VYYGTIYKSNKKISLQCRYRQNAIERHFTLATNFFWKIKCQKQRQLNHTGM
jgi:hypothetical protein